jgi:predicted CopG family antitoxin
MYLKKIFPYIVAGYVIAVGLFFCASVLLEGAFINPKPPGSRFLLAVSIMFIGAGVFFIYLYSRGKLKRSGKSISEVRQEAVEKLKDPAMLARIALEDQNPDIRKTAEERLEELNN